jgi:hypothetical protein
LHADPHDLDDIVILKKPDHRSTMGTVNEGAHHSFATFLGQTVLYQDCTNRLAIEHSERFDRP